MNVATRAAPKTNYVLIDFESVQVKSLALLAGGPFKVHLFLGPNHTKIPKDLVLAMHALGERAIYVQLQTPGPNALDFHIAYYLGALAASDSGAFFHIISKDTGFDPLIRHLKEKNIFSARFESIEAMPCFRSGASQDDAGDEAPTSDRLAALVKLAIDDLVKRKSAKPRKLATLRSTVLARLGKAEAASVDPVIDALVRKGYVATEDDKVTYNLPG